MPLPITFEKIGTATWRMTWSGTGPFELYDGKLAVVEEGISPTTQTEYVTLHDDQIEPPALEVLDTDSESSTDSEYFVNAPYLNIVWRGDSNVDQYHIQRFESGAWATKAPIMESGRGYYVHETEQLTDGESQQFRVRGETVDDDGNVTATTMLEFTTTLVANPGVPSYSGTVSGGTLSISSR